MTVHVGGSIWTCDTCDGTGHVDRMKSYRVGDRWVVLCSACQDGATPLAADVVDRADEVEPFNE